MWNKLKGVMAVTRKPDHPVIPPVKVVPAPSGTLDFDNLPEMLPRIDESGGDESKLMVAPGKLGRDESGTFFLKPPGDQPPRPRSPSNTDDDGAHSKWPWKMEKSGKNLIKKVLQHDEYKRWGSAKFPVIHIKTHKFFENVIWSDVLNLKNEPQYKPVINDGPETILAGKDDESLEDDGPDMSKADANIWNVTLDQLARTGQDDPNSIAQPALPGPISHGPAHTAKWKRRGSAGSKHGGEADLQRQISDLSVDTYTNSPPPWQLPSMSNIELITDSQATDTFKVQSST